MGVGGGSSAPILERKTSSVSKSPGARAAFPGREPGQESGREVLLAPGSKSAETNRSVQASSLVLRKLPVLREAGAGDTSLTSLPTPRPAVQHFVPHPQAALRSW